MTFWDSSAIVLLVIEQDASPDAVRWLAKDGEIAIWTLSPVEVVSALRRLVRGGQLEERAAIDAERLVVELSSRAHVVVDVERVKETAGRLLRVHALRAADALQLAAALAWADGRTTGLPFVTLDRKLALAAAREGFLLEGRSDR